MMKLAVLGCLAVNTLAQFEPGYHPVIVVGPLIGQSLEVLNEDDGSVCNTKGEWKWAWGNPNTSKLDLLCLVGGLSLNGWDSKENLAIPEPKVKVRPRGGYADGFVALDPLFGAHLLDGPTHIRARFHALGYEEGKTLFGHGYDWRLGVHDWQVSSFPELQKIIERAVEVSSSPVVLTGISMAGPYTHAFLSWAREQDPGWVQKHVHAFVPVGAPFNGAVMALSAIVSSALQTFSTEGYCPKCDPAKPAPTGPEQDENLVDELKSWFAGAAKGLADEVLKKLIWSWPSMYFMSTGVDYSTEPPTDPEVITLLNGEAPPECSVQQDTGTKCGSPQTREGWKFDDPTYVKDSQCAGCYKISSSKSCEEGYDKAFHGWVRSLCCKRYQCDAKTYRASELPDFLEKIGRADSASMMKYALSVGTTTDPGVPVHCVISHNVQTFSKLAFHTSEDVTSEMATITLDDGDQTVDAKSLEVCTRWKSTLKTYRVPGVKHGGMLDVDQVLDVIVAVATNNTDAWTSWKEPALSEVTCSGGNGTLADPKDLLINRPHKLQNLLV